MSYWIGAVLGLIGLALLIGSRTHRVTVRAARAEAIRRGIPAERPIAADSIAALGEMIAPVILIALAWFTLKICVAFYMVDTSAYFNVFDLAGTLVLVAGYASWLLAKTHYRMPDLGAAGDTVAPTAKAAAPASVAALNFDAAAFGDVGYVPRGVQMAATARAAMEKSP